jgi:ATP-dependent DNA helicase DinG
MAGAIDDTSMGGPPEEPDRPIADAPPVVRSARTAVTQGRAWTSTEDDELREGVDLGLTLDELASHLDLDTDVVAARLTLLSLELSEAPKMF